MAKTGPQLALAKGFKTKTPPPDDPPGEQDLSSKILKDANDESIRFLQDVALDVQYGPYAAKGIKVEEYQALLRLAIQDCFQDLPEEKKAEGLPEHSLDALRQKPEYQEIAEQLGFSAARLSKPETSKQWIERVADRVRRNVERGSRLINDQVLGRDAIKAATEILEIETPKASRMPGNKLTFNIPPEMVRLMAEAFRESGKSLPALPEAVIDAEPLPEEKDGSSRD